MPDTLVFNVDDEPRWYYTDKVNSDDKMYIYIKFLAHSVSLPNARRYHTFQHNTILHSTGIPREHSRPFIFDVCYGWRMYLVLVSEILTLIACAPTSGICILHECFRVLWRETTYDNYTLHQGVNNLFCGIICTFSGCTW